ncbi:hypothetical protein U1Q18_019297 [Sarracenia purpurea var. burkii]
MSLSTLEEERIFNLLRDENSRTIVLVGKPGSGKTWMARKLSALAMREEDLFDFTLWVFLNRKYNNKSLCTSIALQLLRSSNKELEVDDNVDFDEVEDEEDLEALKLHISKTLVGKKFLLLLDDEGNKMKEDDIEKLLPFPLQNSRKVLITSVNKEGSHKDSENKTVIQVGLLSREESLSLLRQRAGFDVFKFQGMEPLAETISARIMDLPAAIVILAKALRYFSELDYGVEFLESALLEEFDGENRNFLQLLCRAHDMLPSSILVDFAWKGRHFFRDRGSAHYNELIAYWIMEGYFGHIDCLEKAYEEGHCVLMELIDCGLLKKAEADCVIMERSVEADYVIKERAMLNLDNCHRYGFGGIASLGLADVFEDGKWRGLGRITQCDGMVKTPCSHKNKGQKLSTLLLDGNRLCGEVLNDFCQSNPDSKLQILAIFNPNLGSLPMALSYMKELDILVLRDCEFLANIDPIQELSKLTVLEISGASSLFEMPHSLFAKITQLQSLNLSSLQIKHLPKSFSKLTQLHWLLIKDCPNLVEVRPLEKCDKLVVVNLSGSTSLKEFPYKRLHVMQKLRTLDLSNTGIRILPKFGELQQLTHILLRNCPVDRLPSIRSLTSLQVLDISGAKEFIEFQDSSFEANVDLQIIDLSGTIIKQLPSNIGNPHHLYLTGCSSLKKLTYMKALKDLEALYLSGPRSLEIDGMFFEYLGKLRVLNISETKIESFPSLCNLCELRQLSLSCCSSLMILPDLNNLKKLEVLDLSGCSDLKIIQPNSFDQMTCLQRLILFETEIESLPSLSNLTNLRQLLLNKCTKLKVLPPLGSLSKLEELNLSSVTCLGETSADFLENMWHLRILDLSETHLKQLPSLSKLKNLNQLLLSGCKYLLEVPGLEALTKLEVLDLSGTALSHLPSLNNFTNLHQLLLRDCPNLEEFLHLEMLDLSGAIIEGFSYEIPESIHLEQFDPQMLMNNQGSGSKKNNCLEEEMLKYQWHIISLPEMLKDSKRPFISVSISKFFQLLKKKPLSRETISEQFHFSVCAVDQRNRKGGMHCYRGELFFRGIYFQARYSSYFKEQERSLEICGFHLLPKGIEDVLSCAEYLFLFDNAFIKDLHDLDVNKTKLMKGCWLERCKNMESIFHSEVTDDIAGWGQNLEMLWISNLLNLNGIYSGKMAHDGFRNLKYLYLDCCPKLSWLFSSSQRPENLEILQIKFCDELEALFDIESTECLLPKLCTLHLWELPKLKTIMCMMPSLHTLVAGECSVLVNVLSPPSLPENLTILKISGCDNLETVIRNSTSTDYKLPNLHTLHLVGLPKLRSIGCELPPLQDPIIKECPKFPKLAVS